MTTPDPIRDLVQQVRQSLDYWRGRPIQPPPPVPEGPSRQWQKMAWVSPPIINWDERKPVTVEEAQKQLLNQMLGYVNQLDVNHVTVAGAPPGVGKSFGAVELAQRLALEGMSVLYLMPQKDHWHTLSKFRHFDAKLWHRWRSFAMPVSGDDDETMCRLSRDTALWLAKGYRLINACHALCPLHQHQCPYRMQGGVKRPIVAGVHEHLVTGLSITGFDVAIVDEVPLRALITPRHIPRDGIYTPGATGPLADLQQRLLELTEDRPKPIGGKALLEEIGPLLNPVYEQFADDDELAPLIPMLQSVDDIKSAGYWYITDLLVLLSGEWFAWQRGEEDWVRRVFVTKTGLDLLVSRNMWQKLPERIIAVDATARADLYQEIVRRPVEVLAPRVANKGCVVQVAGSMCNKTALMTKDRPPKPLNRAHQLAAKARDICHLKGYKRPGVVTFMALEALFKKVVPNVVTAHFYGQRGSNALERCDVIFVIGTPSPPDTSLIYMASQIYGDRMTPFVMDRSVELRPFPLTKDGVQPARMVSGYWHDPALAAVLAIFREDEVYQAIGRGRPVRRQDVDVWYFGGVPVPGVDEVYETAEEALGIPSGFTLSQWASVKSWVESVQEISAPGLARELDVTARLVRQRKMLDGILAHYPSRFEIASITSGKRGKKAQGLRVVQRQI